MRAGHEGAPIRPRGGFAENLPLLDRREADIRRNRLFERFGRFLVAGEIGVGKRTLGRDMDGFAVAHFTGSGLDVPLFAGKFEQKLACCRGPLAHGGDRSRRTAAARRDAVVGHEAGVSHDELNDADRDAQFFGRGLRQLSSRTLASLDFSRENRDRAVLSKVDSRRDTAGAAAAKSAAAAPLRQGGGGTGRNEQPRAQELHETAPFQPEVKVDGLERLCVICLQVLRRKRRHASRRRKFAMITHQPLRRFLPLLQRRRGSGRGGRFFGWCVLVVVHPPFITCFHVFSPSSSCG